MSEIAAAIQGFKLLWDKIQATKELSNSTELLIAVNDVQQKLMGANTAALELTNQVRELQAQLATAEDWKSEIKRYELFVLPSKALAYKLKDSMASGQPLHYLCTACADKKKKTILQPVGRFLNCPDDKHHTIRAEDDPPYRPRKNPDSWKTT